MDTYTEPHWSASALITIDMQKDFVLPGAAAEIEGSYDIIKNIQLLAEHFRKNGRPVIHVIRLYKEDGSNAERCRKQTIREGKKIVAPESEGAELVDELKPDLQLRLSSNQLLNGSFQKAGPEEWIAYKPRWGAFYNTNLEDFLTEKGVNTLVFCGCNFPNCPRTSVYEACERDFRIALAQDAISGIYQKGIEELTGIGTGIYTAEEVIKQSETE